MRFSVLASGSRANCTFIEAAGVRLLVDCGLSAKQTEQRLARLGIQPDTLDGILITHEHRDHIAGISVMSRRHRLPVYANRLTAEYLGQVHALEYFDTGHPFEIDGVRVAPFQIVHDASDPVGFLFHAEGLRLGHATDLGRVTPLVRDALRLCDGLVLESNHDVQLLRQCEYPWVLKQRIASSHGHLSNEDAGSLLAELMHCDLRHIVLAHLSENSNTPECALDTVSRVGGVLETAYLRCATPYTETPILDLAANGPRQAIGY